MSHYRRCQRVHPRNGRHDAATVGADIQVVTNLDAFAQPIEIDRSQLEKVLMNLAINARDAMEHGGRLDFHTSNVVVSDATRLTVSPGRYVVVTVADTGCGMDKLVQAQIFEPFFTTKQKVDIENGKITEYRVALKVTFAWPLRKSPCPATDTSDDGRYPPYRWNERDPELMVFMTCQRRSRFPDPPLLVGRAKNPGLTDFDSSWFCLFPLWQA